MKIASMLDGPGRAPRASSEAYRSLLERLYALSKGGTKFGLGRVSRVLATLGHPELSFPTVHVAGSNGKGSTCAFLAAILSAHGRRVGMYTSPHLISLTERIQFISACLPEQIAQDELVSAADRVEEVAPGFGDLSFFEAVTCAAMVAFERRSVDIAVVEAGLGARLDATRLIDPDVAVLTDLSLEHTDILGESIEEIATEEGAVIRPKRPIVAANGPPGAMRVIEDLAKAAGAPLYRIGDQLRFRLYGDGTLDLFVFERTIERVKLSLLGPHQLRNALLASAAALLVEPTIAHETIKRGLESAIWPGRMEIFERAGAPPVLLDGAHNPHGAEVLAVGLRADSRFERPLHFVFGVLSDKDLSEMLSQLAPMAASFTLARPSSLRARDPEEIRDILMDARPRVPARVASTLGEAMDLATARARADNGWVVVCGSLYLVGDVRALLLDPGFP